MMKREEVIRKLREYKPVLEKRYGVTKVGIFGSVARGDESSRSDIDIVVELKEISPFILVDIKRELTKLLECEVDVVRLRKNLNKMLKRRIEKEAIYV